MKAGDPWTDLAVLKIAATDLEPMPLGDASRLRKGMIVIALGNPYGIARDGEVSASWGIISNLRRATAPDPQCGVGAERSTLDQYGTLIQTDARLDWGTSGGALVNLQGEMIGLTTSLAAMAGYEQPAGLRSPWMTPFARRSRRSSKGVCRRLGFWACSPTLAAGRSTGGTVRRPRAARGAGNAGPEGGTPEDDVITHVNKERVFDKNSLFRELSRLPADETVTLTFERTRSLRQPRRRDGDRRPVEEVRVDDARRRLPRWRTPWRGLRVEYPSALPPQLSTQGLQAVDPEGAWRWRTWTATRPPGRRACGAGNTSATSALDACRRRGSSTRRWRSSGG